MRLAFVLRLGTDTRPADGFFEGWIEEVDSCTELRFRSTDELLKFLGDRFTKTTAVVNQVDSKESVAVRKATRVARVIRRKPNSRGDL